VQEHWDSCLLTRIIPVNEGVNIVTFSPDGKQIIYGVNNTVELWDSSTGTILHTLEGHFGFVHSVACSRDGKQVASGAFDRTVRIWDPSSGAVLHMLNCDDIYGANSLAFSMDGKQVASAGEWTRGGRVTSWVQIWDTATGAEIRTLEVPSGGQISFSPNDKWFLSTHTDHVCLWDLATGTLIQKFGHNAHVYSAAFSPDSKYVAVVGKGDLRFYDTTLGLQQKYDYSLVAPVPEDELSDIRLISFSPDGNRLVGTSFSGTLWIWDATTGAELQTFMRYSGVVAAAFSPDGKQVVSIAREGKVQLWDASMKLPAVTHSGLTPSVSPDTTAGETQVSSVAFLLDGKIVLSGAGDRMRLWDIGTGILLQEVIASGSIETIVVSSDGRQVASAARGTIQFWYVTLDERLQYRCHIRDDGHPFIEGSTLSSDGERFLCARFRHATGDSPPEVARLWNVHTGTVLRKIYPTDPDSDSRDASTLISLSPDGKHILRGFQISPVDIKISDAATGLPLQDIQCDCESIVALNFSPDNKRIVVSIRPRTWNDFDTLELYDIRGGTWNDFDTLELYDVKGGALLQTFEVPVSIQSLTFSPDGSAEPGLYLLKDWAMDGQQRLLFLPPEYRSSTISVNGRSIALATGSQKLLILQFDEPSKII
jgi:WD40 repeat protein